MSWPLSQADNSQPQHLFAQSHPTYLTSKISSTHAWPMHTWQLQVKKSAQDWKVSQGSGSCWLLAVKDSFRNQSQQNRIRITHQTRQLSPSLHHLTLCIYIHIYLYLRIFYVYNTDTGICFFCTLYIHMYIVHTDPLLRMASNPWTNTPKLKHGKPFSCFNKNQLKDHVPPSPPDPLSLEPKHGVWLPGGASIWKRKRHLAPWKEADGNFSASPTATTPAAPPGSCLLSGSLDHHVAELQGQRQHGTESLKGVTAHGTIGQTPEPWCWGGKKND